MKTQKQSKAGIGLGKFTFDDSSSGGESDRPETAASSKGQVKKGKGKKGQQIIDVRGMKISQHFIKSTTIQPTTLPEKKEETTKADGSPATSDSEDIDPRFKFPGTAQKAQQPSTSNEGGGMFETGAMGPAPKTQIGRSMNALASDFGDDVLKYFKSMNWKEGGLGKNETGQANPIEADMHREKGVGVQPDEKIQSKDELFRQERGGEAGSRYEGKAKSGIDILLGSKDERADREAARKQRDQKRKFFTEDDKVDYTKGPRKARKVMIRDNLDKKHYSSRIIDMSKAGGPQVVENFAQHMSHKVSDLEGSIFKDLLTTLDAICQRGNDEIEEVGTQIRNCNATLAVLSDDGGGSTSTTSGDETTRSKKKTKKPLMHPVRIQIGRKQIKQMKEIQEKLDKEMAKINSTRNTLPAQGARSEDGINTTARLDQILTIFEEIKRDYPENWSYFELNVTAGEHILSEMRQIVSVWDPFEDDPIDDLLERIESLAVLKFDSNKRQSNEKRKNLQELAEENENDEVNDDTFRQVFNILMTETLLPKMRTTIGDDSIFKPLKSRADMGMALVLLDTAEKFLPKGNYTNMMRFNVLPKLLREVDRWNWRAIQFPDDMESVSDLWLPHQWYGAWKGQFENLDDLTDMGSKIQTKILEFLSARGAWNVFKQSRHCADLLRPWESYVHPGAFREMCFAVVQRLEDDIIPDDSPEIARMLLVWRQTLPQRPYLALIEKYFFQPLRNNLKRRLQSAYSEQHQKSQQYQKQFLLGIREWYKWWRQIFTSPVLEFHHDLREQFGYLLQLIECWILDKKSSKSPSFFACDANDVESSPSLSVQCPNTDDGIIEQIFFENDDVSDDESNGFAGSKKSKKATVQGARYRTKQLLAQWKQQEKTAARRTARPGQNSHLDEPEWTLKQTIEHIASTKNIELRHKQNLVSKSGKSWYSMNGESKKVTHYIYWDNDIIFHTNDLQTDYPKIRPVSIETLFQMVS